MTITYTTNSGTVYRRCDTIDSLMLSDMDIAKFMSVSYRRSLPIKGKSYIQRLFITPIKEVKRSTYTKEVSTFSNGDSYESVNYKTINF